MTPKDYKDNFHQAHFQNSVASANEVVPLFMSYFTPKTVLDVGCGLGTWLQAFAQRNCEVFGIDGDYVKTEDLVIAPASFKPLDLNAPYQLGKKFDLAISLEVAEHIYPENARTFIDSLCQHSDIVLFSAAVPGQEGTLHYNEQYNEYWMALFFFFFYQCIDFLRHKIWNNTKISWWYRQNILVFIRESSIGDPKFARIASEKTNYSNTYIHPSLLKYKTNKADKLEKILNSPLAILKYYLKRKKGY